MSCIYHIKSSLTNKEYIGQTKFSAESRLAQHKSNARRLVDGCLYDEMRRVGVDNWNVEVLEHLQIGEDVDKKERYWICKLRTHWTYGGLNITRGGKVRKAIRMRESKNFKLNKDFQNTNPPPPTFVGRGHMVLDCK
jgi:hypothetical protein